MTSGAGLLHFFFRKDCGAIIFNSELSDTDNFVATLELVSARESFGQKTDTLVGIARDAFADGRVSAVSIIDNWENEH